MKHAILLLALSGLVCAADGDDVRAAVDQFNAAARKGDHATLDKMLSADLFYVHSSAKRENKAECLAALVKGKPNFEMKPGYDVKVYGNTAVVHAFMTSHSVVNGAPAKTELDVVQVWVKGGGAWKMVGRHTTRLP